MTSSTQTGYYSRFSWSKCIFRVVGIKIFIFHSKHFSLAVIVNPTAWAAPGASFGETRVYYLCSMGWKLSKDARKEILQLLAQVGRRLKGKDEYPHQFRHVPSDEDLEAIAQNIVFKEVTVRSPSEIIESLLLIAASIAGPKAA